MEQEKKYPRLENWDVGTDERLVIDNPYMPPEMFPLSAEGNVYGSDEYEDGEKIVTSMIIKMEDSHIYTKTGSIYKLGEPDKEYVEWCKEKGCHVPTKEEPIKVRE